jgi:hypothetical protein
MSYINLKRYFVIALSIVMLSGISVFGFAQQAQAEGPNSPRRKQRRRHSADDSGASGIRHSGNPDRHPLFDRRSPVGSFCYRGNIHRFSDFPFCRLETGKNGCRYGLYRLHYR